MLGFNHNVDLPNIKHNYMTAQNGVIILAIAH